MTEQNQNGAKPEFDFSNFSWRDDRRIMILQAKIGKAAEDHDIEAIEEGYLEIERFFAIILVSVPREWLVKNAPASIDWSQPDSLQWLRGDKSKDLLTALQEFRSPEATEKNSEAALS